MAYEASNGQVENRPMRAICLAGPTGSGKTALAIELARILNCQIVNTDSRQVYADFPIITAQPSADELSRARHHLYGFLPASQKISAGQWLEHARSMARQIVAQGSLPLFVGGTGLYFQALLHGLAVIPPVDPEISGVFAAKMRQSGPEAMHTELALKDPDYAARIHPRDRQRIQRALEVYASTGRPFSWWHAHATMRPVCEGLLLVVDVKLAELESRLDRRIDHMLEAGAVEEARIARVKYPDGGAPAWSGIGCAELLSWLEKKIDFDECRRLWLANTRAYAKRQLTWFRGRPESVWIRPKAATDAIALASRFIENE